LDVLDHAVVRRRRSTSSASIAEVILLPVLAGLDQQHATALGDDGVDHITLSPAEPSVGPGDRMQQLEGAIGHGATDRARPTPLVPRTQPA
jgi:hypothetical protein